MSIPEQAPAPQAPIRQYVNFVFYQVDPAWRRLPEDVRTQGKQEFLKAVEDYAGKVLVVPYSTIGIRGDCDFMLWRISYDLDLFQDMSTKILASGLGQYLYHPLFLSRDDQTVCLCRPSFARGSGKQTADGGAGEEQIYLRVSVPEDARMVPAHESGPTGHDG